MSIKVVLFDLDDTLYLERDYIKSGFSVVSNFISKKIEIKEQEIYLKILALFNENSKNVFNRLLDFYHIEYKEKDIMEIVEVYKNHFPNIKLLEESKTLIKELKNEGYKLGIITDGDKVQQNLKIKALNLNNYFDKIIVTDELGEDRKYWKPHKLSYELMKDFFEVEYNQMIYIGDNLSKDFKAPLKLGIKSIYIYRKEGIYNQVNLNKEIATILNLNELEKGVLYYD